MSVTLDDVVKYADTLYPHADVDVAALRAELAELRQKAYTLDWLERHGRYPGPPPGLRPASPPQGYPHPCRACGKVLRSHADYVQHMAEHMVHVEPSPILRWEADEERSAFLHQAARHAEYRSDCAAEEMRRKSEERCHRE